jgi:hypothetical protein
MWSRCLDIWTSGWLYSQLKEWMSEQLDIWTSGQLDGCFAGGCQDGNLAVPLDFWMSGHQDV